ncbi:MAG: hypothetical protein V4622_11720 [Bacteroidota bacterium]
MKHLKSAITLAFFSLTSNLSFSQFSQEYCFHIEKTSNPPKIISYLFANYGKEKTEEILLNIKSYEFEHQVKVLYKDEFYTTIEKLNQQIDEVSDLEFKTEIENRKQKFVLFNSIEEELTH